MSGTDVKHTGESPLEHRPQEPAGGDHGGTPAGPTGEASPPRRRRWRRVLLGVGVPVVLLGGGYVAAAYVLGDRVPRETSVVGVEIGGMTVAQAEQALTDGLADVVAQPIDLVAGEAHAQIDPAAAGLALDAQATVAQFAGTFLSPKALLGHVVGLGEQQPVTSVDEVDLEAVIGVAAQDLDVAPVEGAITFEGAEIVVVEAEDGFEVDVERTARVVRDAWLYGESIEAVTQTVPPVVGPDAVETALEQIARPLTSGPVSVVAGEAVADVPVEDLTAVSVVEPEGAELVLRVDGEALAERVHERNPQIGQAPRDATVRIESGRPVVVPSVAGVGFDTEELTQAVTDAALSTTDRTAEVELVQTEPDFTTAAAEALRVVEVISEFSTPLTADAQRTHNLVVGTRAINGTLVKPGETFSLIQALGPVTPAQGYNRSGVVVDGNVSQAVGGGLSQLSTTTFNAAFEAGMDDVFHKPHSRWFSRYPAGREATMFTPDLDMKWRNNTDYGVLVQSWVANNRTWVRLWGTKVWDVNIVSGQRYNIRQPTTVYNTSAQCTPESGGSAGFSINVTRTRAKDGQVVDRETLSTTYQPWNRVVCGSAPTASTG